MNTSHFPHNKGFFPEYLYEKTQGINLKQYKPRIRMKSVDLPHILVGNTEISLKL